MTANGIRVTMSDAGARAVLNSSAVQAKLLVMAQSIKANADSMGSGVYDADVRVGQTRAHAMVKTTDAASMASNAKHNTLLKSLDAGRG